MEDGEVLCVEVYSDKKKKNCIGTINEELSTNRFGYIGYTYIL